MDDNNIMNNLLRGYKTHRLKTNPMEKKIIEIFKKQFSDLSNNLHKIKKDISRIIYPSDDFELTNKEIRIIFSTIQWLGSPVGIGFLKNCGFEYNGDKKDLYESIIQKFDKFNKYNLDELYVICSYGDTKIQEDIIYSSKEEAENNIKESSKFTHEVLSLRGYIDNITSKIK